MEIHRGFRGDLAGSHEECPVLVPEDVSKKWIIVVSVVMSNKIVDLIDLRLSVDLGIWTDDRVNPVAWSRATLSLGRS